jgi:hypothetical protein
VLVGKLSRSVLFREIIGGNSEKYLRKTTTYALFDHKRKRDILKEI